MRLVIFIVLIIINIFLFFLCGKRWMPEWEWQVYYAAWVLWGCHLLLILVLTISFFAQKNLLWKKRLIRFLFSLPLYLWCWFLLFPVGTNRPGDGGFLCSEQINKEWHFEFQDEKINFFQYQHTCMLASSEYYLFVNRSPWPWMNYFRPLPNQENKGIYPMIEQLNDSQILIKGKLRSGNFGEIVYDLKTGEVVSIQEKSPTIENIILSPVP